MTERNMEAHSALSSADTGGQSGSPAACLRAKPRRGLFGFAGLALLSVACGGAPMPTQQLTTAESAVKAAEMGGAEDLPKGELHLKYARDAVAEARRLIDEGNNEAARLALERAKVDADKALALAEEKKARDLAEAELKRIEEMMKK